MLLSTNLISEMGLSNVIGDLLVTKCQNSSGYVSEKRDVCVSCHACLKALSCPFPAVTHLTAVLYCTAIVLPCSVALSGVFNQTLIPLSKYRNVFHF